MFHREKRIGSVPAIPSSAISHSRIGLGFEKLDRGAFEPANAYDPVGASGVKWIRIQSGWPRTETAPGVYDWGWLDDIVDNLRSRGLEPWMCLCYGNRLYTSARPRSASAGWAARPCIHRRSFRHGRRM